jgi:hypothetical protein
MSTVEKKTETGVPLFLQGDKDELWRKLGNDEVKGTAERLGCGGEQGMTDGVFGWLGLRNGVGFAPDGNRGRWVDLMAIDCPGDLTARFKSQGGGRRFRFG